MKSVMLCVCIFCALSATVSVAKAPYNFRESEAYGKLSEPERQKLEQVHRDFMILWGALDRYADYNDGSPPDRLEDLVPHFLAELPTDPFATDETTADENVKLSKTSKDGRGYRYRDGYSRAWCLSSVGLPRFPYLAAEGNVGLYVCKGIWFGPGNIPFVKGSGPAKSVESDR